MRDRIDLVVEVAATGFTARSRAEESSAVIRQRVCAARARQRLRFGGAKLNSELEGAALREWCSIDLSASAILDAAIQKFCLSVRGCDRVLRVSRTIADLSSDDAITTGHVAEAIQYRSVVGRW